jgi:hypothetical protein
MPRTAVGVRSGVGNRGQRAMHLSLLGVRRRPVDGRPDERMAEQDPDPDLDKRCIEGRDQSLAREAKAVCCPPQ